MTEALFSIARANMCTACKLYCVLGDDPRELNMIGYHLQQAASWSGEDYISICFDVLKGIDSLKDVQRLMLLNAKQTETKMEDKQ